MSDKNSIAKLSSVLSKRMQAVQQAGSVQSLFLGRIQSDMSLLLDGINGEIPKGEYSMGLQLTSDSSGANRGVRAGDRVLVALLGYEPIVIAIVVKS